MKNFSNRRKAEHTGVAAPTRGLARGRRGLAGTAVMAAAIFFAQAAAEAAWRQEITGTAEDRFDAARDVALDSSGDVFLGGVFSLPDNAYSFVVAKLSGTDGTELWRSENPGSSDPDRGARVVAVDGDDNVFAAGELDLFFTVIKYDGTTGAELWRAQLDGTNTSFRTAQEASAMVLDSAGDVVAAGFLNNEGFGRDLLVVKFDGATGAEQWRFEIDGGEGLGDQAFAVAVDAADDVAVGGKLETLLTSDDFTVIKLAGASGAELWRQVIDGTETASDDDDAYTVAFDGAGDVLAGGVIDNDDTHEDFAVLKFNGSTGAEIWRQEIDGDLPGKVSFETVKKLVVDADDNVIATGELENLSAVQDLTVIKFDGATGAELWRQEIDGNDSVAFDAAYDVTLTPDGDVVAVGRLENIPIPVFEFTVAKIDGDDGTKLWQQEMDGTDTRSAPGMEEALAVAVDAAGDVVAAGYVDNKGSGEDWAVVKLDGDTGILGPLYGSKFLFKDLVGKPERRKILASMRDVTLVVPPAGSAQDPTIAGAEVTISNQATAEEVVFTLPPGAAWRAAGDGSRGYQYGDKDGLNGACRLFRIRPGGSVKLVCNGRTGPIAYSLDEATQDEMVVSIRFGGGAAQCAVFGGRVNKDSGTSNPGPKGIFKAAAAPVALGESCP
jgi:hypothetical protein